MKIKIRVAETEGTQGGWVVKVSVEGSSGQGQKNKKKVASHNHTSFFCFFTHSNLSKAVAVARQTKQRHTVAAVAKIVEHIASNSADRSRNLDV